MKQLYFLFLCYEVDLSKFSNKGNIESELRRNIQFKCVERNKSKRFLLDMDQDVIACQDVQPLDNCTTKHYMDTLLDECGCIPWNIRISDKVWNRSNIKYFRFQYPNNFLKSFKI